MPTSLPCVFQKQSNLVQSWCQPYTQNVLNKWLSLLFGFLYISFYQWQIFHIIKKAVFNKGVKWKTFTESAMFHVFNKILDQTILTSDQIFRLGNILAFLKGSPPNQFTFQSLFSFHGSGQQQWLWNPFTKVLKSKPFTSTKGFELLGNASN